MKSTETTRARFLASCLAALGLLAAGCSASRMVRIETKPEGAAIYVNGERRGITPETVEIRFEPDPGGRAIIQIVKEKYKPILQPWRMTEVPNEKTYTLERE